MLACLFIIPRKLPTTTIKLSSVIKHLNEHRDLFEHNVARTILRTTFFLEGSKCRQMFSLFYIMLLMGFH